MLRKTCALPDDIGIRISGLTPVSPRHWHDLVRLDEAGFATAAVADRELANAVARHKTMFFGEKAADRSHIDYAAAVNGGLQLVPAGDAAKALAEDYARMVDDGLLLVEAEPFETLMERCADIATRANSAAEYEERGWGASVFISGGPRGHVRQLLLFFVSGELRN
jgi:hypothetical protein